MIGVTLNSKHCLNDYGMILASKIIGLPEVQTTYITVPGRDGPLDMTEALSGDVHYNSRIIELEFVTNEYVSKQNWAEFLSTIANDLHGKEIQIVFDDDSEYYYVGRCEINEFTTSWGKQTINLYCTCDPFKYNSAGEKRL